MNNKIKLIFGVLVVVAAFLFLAGCVEDISDEELDKELEQLSEEELEYVLAEDEAIVGEAIASKYRENSKLSRLKKAVKQRKTSRVEVKEEPSAGELVFSVFYKYQGPWKYCMDFTESTFDFMQVNINESDIFTVTAEKEGDSLVLSLDNSPAVLMISKWGIQENKFYALGSVTGDKHEDELDGCEAGELSVTASGLDYEVNGCTDENNIDLSPSDIVLKNPVRNGEQDKVMFNNPHFGQLTLEFDDNCKLKNIEGFESNLPCIYMYASQGDPFNLTGCLKEDANKIYIVIKGVACNGQTVDLQTDPNNCGFCGNVCSAKLICQAGVCKRNLTQCNDDLDNDGDGSIDYPADNSCENFEDDDESDGIAVAACGVDADCPGEVCRDEACITEEAWAVLMCEGCPDGQICRDEACITEEAWGYLTCEECPELCSSEGCTTEAAWGYLTCGEECPSGICRNENCTEVGAEVICGDSDGGNDIYVQGRCFDAFTDLEDSCISNSNVRELYCRDRNTCWVADVDCPNGCQDGACVPITCTDSDGGQDHYTKGHLVGEMEQPGGTTYHLDSNDTCTDETRLSEYYCYTVGDNAYGTWQTYNCANESKVCQEGACVEE